MIQSRLFGLHKTPLITPRSNITTTTPSSSSSSRVATAATASQQRQLQFGGGNNAFERQHAAFSNAASTSSSARSRTKKQQIPSTRLRQGGFESNSSASDSDPSSEHDDVNSQIRRERERDSSTRRRPNHSQTTRSSQQRVGREPSTPSNELQTDRLDQRPRISLASMLGTRRSSCSSDSNTSSNPNPAIRKILNPSQTQKGSRLEFDYDNDDDSMLSESQVRRKRKDHKVWYGGNGQLDLAPIEDMHDGGLDEEDFARQGSRSSNAGIKRRPCGNLDATGSSKKYRAVNGRDGSQISQSTTHRLSRSNRHRASQNVQPSSPPFQPQLAYQAQHESQEGMTRVSASPSEAETEDDDLPYYSAAVKSLTYPPEPADETADHSQRSFADSSQSQSDEENHSIQQRLLITKDRLVLEHTLTSSPTVLVGDSEDEDVDGFRSNSQHDGREDTVLDRLASKLNAADDSGFAEMESSSPVLEEGLTLPSSQTEELRRISPFQGLARTESSILMPPPPLPIRSRPIRQIVQPPRKEDVSVFDIETQWPDLGPTAQKSDRLKASSTSPDEPQPKQATLNPISTWSSVESAWQGVKPPSPIPPRQANLFEFFKTQPEGAIEDDECAVVEDSQPAALPLDQMNAFRSAFEHSLQMGRSVRKGGSIEGNEEEEEVEEDFEDARMRRSSNDERGEEDQVPSSDQEDEPWSPLGSPEKNRFPGLLVSLGPKDLKPSKPIVDKYSQQESMTTIALPGGSKSDLSYIHHLSQRASQSWEEEAEEEEDNAQHPQTEPDLPELSQSQAEVPQTEPDLPDLPSQTYSLPPSSQKGSEDRCMRSSQFEAEEDEDTQGARWREGDAMREQAAEEAEEASQWESYWTIESIEPSPFQELIDDAESL